MNKWANFETSASVVIFCYFILSSITGYGDACSSSGTGVTQQVAVQIVTPDYSQTSPSQSPPLSSFGVQRSCGHNLYWNDGETPGGGIVAGREAKYGEFPWQVFVETQRFYCGGSIINSNHVLTAAHCLEGAANTVQVSVGNRKSRYRSPLDACKFTIHPNYVHRRNVSVNDLAVIRLRTPLDFSAWEVQPICLPKSCSETPGPGEFAIASGWGIDDNGGLSDVMRTTTMMIISNTACASYYGDTFLFENTVCAGTPLTATCSGDSGGPFAVFKNGYFTQIGIVSSGAICSEATKGPSVFTRVCNYTPWINSLITGTC